MDFSLKQFKQSTFKNDQDLHEFHFTFASLLRWKLKEEDENQIINKLLIDLEFIHSQYLYYGNLTPADVYEVVLGDRLDADPNYILRIAKTQARPELYARLQSKLSNVKLKAIYPKLLQDIFVHFDNPELDSEVLNLKRILLKWELL